MKPRNQSGWARGGLLLVLAAAGLAFVGGAQAQSLTPAGTTISNKATLNYSVGAVGQPAIASSPTGSSDGTGLSTDFVVDNKINHTVTTTNGSAVVAIPGQTSVVLNFNVTNTGNATQGYLLSVANVATGEAVLGGNDTHNLDTTTCVIDAGAGATNIASLAAELTRAVTVSCTIPTTLVNNNRVALALVAQATDNNTTTPVVATVGGGTLGGTDIVFADTAGPDTVIDGNRDGKASGRSAYLVQTATVVVQKTAAVRCDPVNGDTAPKSIPAAYIRYTITVTNGGGAGASALLTTMTDTLDANVDFDSHLIQGTGGAENCVATGTPSGASNRGVQVTQTNRGVNAFLTNTSADSDGLIVAGAPSTLSFNFAQVLPAVPGTYQAGELKAGEVLTLVYQVKIK